MPSPRVRFVGSRELHRDLPKVLKALDDPKNRYVLTIHNKPRAVMIGMEAFLELLNGHSPADRLLALQLGALVQGHESDGDGEDPGDGDPDDPSQERDGRKADALIGAY